MFLFFFLLFFLASEWYRKDKRNCLRQVWYEVNQRQKLSLRRAVSGFVATYDISLCRYCWLWSFFVSSQLKGRFVKSKWLWHWIKFFSPVEVVLSMKYKKYDQTVSGFWKLFLISEITSWYNLDSFDISLWQWLLTKLLSGMLQYHHTKMKFSIKDFFGKYDQIRCFLWTENFFFVQCLFQLDQKI